MAKKKSFEMKLKEINEKLSRISADTENARNASESIEPATENSSAAPDSTPTPAPRRQSPKHPPGLPIPRAYGEYKYPFEYSPIREATVIESVEPASRQGWIQAQGDITTSRESTESVTTVEDASQQPQTMSPREQGPLMTSEQRPMLTPQNISLSQRPDSMSPSQQPQCMSPSEQRLLATDMQGQSSAMPISISISPNPINKIETTQPRRSKR
ncbi:hypothetical protein N7467_001919 [Penicillium canescens]|nr:hypothetical protein N7467_001919 [Penicillium canescens]